MSVPVPEAAVLAILIWRKPPTRMVGRPGHSLAEAREEQAG
jgi:hypothetical protein